MNTVLTIPGRLSKSDSLSHLTASSFLSPHSMANSASFSPADRANTLANGSASRSPDGLSLVRPIRDSEIKIDPRVAEYMERFEASTQQVDESEPSTSLA
jgi:hypothetical protein